MRAVLLVVFTCSLIALAMYPSNAYLQAHEYRQVTIRPGDTLWQIAQEYIPDKGDVREFVSALYLLNGIAQSETIYPGQVIKVPVNYK